MGLLDLITDFNSKAAELNDIITSLPAATLQEIGPLTIKASDLVSELGTLTAGIVAAGTALEGAATSINTLVANAAEGSQEQADLQEIQDGITAAQAALATTQKQQLDEQTAGDTIAITSTNSAPTQSVGGTQSFFATVSANGTALSLQPPVTWSAVLGTIDSNGGYTAPQTAGADTITATSGSVSATYSLTIV